MQYSMDEGVQGICPSGWHIPTDLDWKTLEMELGMTQEEADGYDWRGTNQGYQLKSNSTLWQQDGMGSNSSGFYALPAGFLNNSGSGGFSSDTYKTFFVSSNWWYNAPTEDTAVMFRCLNAIQSDIQRMGKAINDGLSLRCLKD